MMSMAFLSATEDFETPIGSQLLSCRCWLLVQYERPEIAIVEVTTRCSSVSSVPRNTRKGAKSRFGEGEGETEAEAEAEREVISFLKCFACQRFLDVSDS